MNHSDSTQALNIESEGTTTDTETDSPAASASTLPKDDGLSTAASSSVPPNDGLSPTVEQAKEKAIKAELPPEVLEARRKKLKELKEQETMNELKYGSDAVVQIMIPVTICMAVVIAIIRTVTFFGGGDGTGTKLLYNVYDESGASGAIRFGQALVNALIMIAAIVVMTFIMVLLYKYKCHRILAGWLFVVSIILLFMFSFTFWQAVFSKYNTPMDWVTTCFVIWNFGVVGICCIHWRGPLILQQAYLIAVSALMALTLVKYLPTWTTWILLALLAVYDLMAVLCPRGPLRMLIEMVHERGDALPAALIYSTMAWITVADSKPEASDDTIEKDLIGMEDSNEIIEQETLDLDYNEIDINQNESTDVLAVGSDVEIPPTPGQNGIKDGEEQAGPSDSAPAAEKQKEHPAQLHTAEEAEDGGGVKLGLGDFIFYSLMIGTAAANQPQWGTVFSCYYAIVAGLTLTLALLAIFKKALPALPISIAFGILFYFTTDLLVIPMTDILTTQQVFV